MLPPVRPIALRREDIHGMGVKGIEELGVIGIGDNRRLDAVVLQILVQDVHHRAVQNPDGAPVQAVRILRNVSIRVVFDKVIGLVAHGRVRIPDQCLPVLSPRKAGKQIDLVVQKHLVELIEVAVYIGVSPAGILGKLLVILVGVSCLDLAVPGAFLKDLVFIVSDANGLAFGIRGSDGRQDERNHNSRTGDKSKSAQRHIVLFR